MLQLCEHSTYLSESMTLFTLYACIAVGKMTIDDTAPHTGKGTMTPTVRRFGSRQPLAALVETGWDPVSAVVDGVSSLADTFSGRSLKEARARQAEAKADEAEALASVERARIASETQLALAQIAAAKPQSGGGIMGKLMAPSPILGLPWLVVGGAAAAGVYYLANR